MSSDTPDPGATPGYIIDPAVPDDAPLTVGEARNLHKAVGTLADTVGTFNNRLAGGERRWAVLTVLGAAIVVVLGGIIWLGLGMNRIARCQAQQNDAIRASTIQVRASRADQDDQSVALLDHQLALFGTVLDPNSTPEQRRDASIAYRQSVQAARASIVAAKQKAEDNPLPTGSCT